MARAVRMLGRIALVVLALQAICAPEAGAQLNSLEVTGSPSLVINTAIAGQPPTSVTATAQYRFATPDLASSTYKIQAIRCSSWPADVTLRVTLEVPSGVAATKITNVVLSTVDADVLRDIPRGLSQTGWTTLTYQLSALSSAGTVPAAGCTVTFKLVAQ